MFAYTLTPDSINIFIRGRAQTVHKTHVNYDAIREKLKNKPVNPSGEWIADLSDLINVKAFLAKITEGRVQVSADTVLVAGKKAHGVAVDRLFEMLKEGFDVKPLCRFLDKLAENPTEDVRTDLYLWLEASKMPLTEDGDFLAYKYVSHDYTSRGGFKNPIGQVVSMPREHCDPNRHKTCSTGLHFASWDYVCGTGSRKIILKVNPRDVVAIPSDYANHKGRACQYEIVGEVTEEQKFEPVVSTVGTYAEPLESVEAENDNVGDGALLEEPVSTRPHILINEKTGEPKFKPPHYAAYNSHSLLAAVKDLGQRGFARDNDVPRTTLQGWVRKAEEWIKQSKRKKRK
jgi:hypothetical protein